MTQTYTDKNDKIYDIYFIVLFKSEFSALFCLKVFNDYLLGRK